MSDRHTYCSAYLFACAAGEVDINEVARQFQEGLGDPSPHIRGKCMVSGTFKSMTEDDVDYWIENANIAVPYVVYTEYGRVIQVLPKGNS